MLSSTLARALAHGTGPLHRSTTGAEELARAVDEIATLVGLAPRGPA